MWKQLERIQQNYHVLLRMNQIKNYDSRHKLTPTTSVPYLFKTVQPHIVLIKRPNKYVEIVSRDRVALTLDPLSAEEMKYTLRPTRMELLEQT